MANKSFIYRTCITLLRENGVTFAEFVAMHDKHLNNQIEVLKKKLDDEANALRVLGAERVERD